MCVGVKKVKALNEGKAGKRERDLGVSTLKFTWANFFAKTFISKFSLFAENESSYFSLSSNWKNANW